jgi:hypothetical protein
MRRSTRIALRRAAWRTVYWVVAPILFLLVFRLVWGFHAQRSVQAMLAHLDDLHVRYRPEQFPDTSGIPAKDNAVDALLAGPLGISTTPAEYKLINDPIEFQTPADREAVLKLLAAHHDLVDRIDAAQSRPTIAWSRDTLVTGKVPRLAGAVESGRLLLKASQIAHEQHDDALALRHLHRLLTVARVLEKSPWLICGLLSLSDRDIAATGIERIQASLDLHDPAAAAAALLKDLCADGPAVTAISGGFEGEITYHYIATDHYTRGFDTSFGSWLRRPLVQESYVRSDSQWAAMVVAFRAPNRPQFLAAQSRLAAFTPNRTALGNMVHLSPLYTPGLFTRYDNALKTVTHARGAAVLLAARLYAARRGHLPDTAAEMTPDILPSIPLDLYLDPDQPLHYRLDPAGPTVWSVFENGLDDGADPKKDLVYGAANPPPAPVPPTPPRAPRTRPASAPAASSRAAGTRSVAP